MPDVAAGSVGHRGLLVSGDRGRLRISTHFSENSVVSWHCARNETLGHAY